MTTKNRIIRQKQLADEFITDKGWVRTQSIGAPALASDTAVHAAVTLGAAAQDVTTAITAPDVARILTIKGNAGGIAGNVIITGTNIRNEVITETIALSGSSSVNGTKAFKTVTNVNFPAKTNGSGDTVSIGVGAKVGLDRRMSEEAIIQGYVDGTREATHPTCTYNSSTIELNTVSFTTAFNGTKIFKVRYFSTEVRTANP